MPSSGPTTWSPRGDDPRCAADDQRHPPDLVYAVRPGRRSGAGVARGLGRARLHRHPRPRRRRVRLRDRGPAAGHRARATSMPRTAPPPAWPAWSPPRSTCSAASWTTLADLVRDGHFAGIHLEGPFLSPAQPGAHEPGLLRQPDPASVRAADHRRPRGPDGGHPRARAARRRGGDRAVPRRPASASPSATPMPTRTSPRPPWTPAPASPPTCSTRCGASTTASRGRSRACSPTRE